MDAPPEPQLTTLAGEQERQMFIITLRAQVRIIIHFDQTPVKWIKLGMYHLETPGFYLICLFKH